MKSRKEYFHSRKLFSFLAFVLYCAVFFLLQLMIFVRIGYFSALFALLSLALVFAVICSILSGRNKDFLFCPKCGSKKIVKTTLFGIPDILYDECPDCHEKLDNDKPVNQD
ncbi:MAG: hypothetical protein IJM51_12150 [Clostridia bacterium]|nr:hypothetical protein [Clostridia bacterium]